MRGGRIKISLLAGHHRPASETPFNRWRDGPTLNAGLIALCFLRRAGPVLLRNLYFCDFPGGPDPLPPLPSGSLHVIDDLNKMRTHSFSYQSKVRLPNQRP